MVFFVHAPNHNKPTLWITYIDQNVGNLGLMVRKHLRYFTNKLTQFTIQSNLGCITTNYYKLIDNLNTLIHYLILRGYRSTEIDTKFGKVFKLSQNELIHNSKLQPYKHQ